MSNVLAQITNADLYLNDASVRGKVGELDLGDIGSTEIEHAALGMIGVLKLPGRPLEAIDGKISFEWLDEAIEKDLLNPTKRHKLQLHSYVDVHDDEGLNSEKSHTLVTHIGFMAMKRGGFKAKLGEGAKVEHNISITSFTQGVYGDPVKIIEYDGFNNIYNVNGAPVWPT